MPSPKKLASEQYKKYLQSGDEKHLENVRKIYYFVVSEEGKKKIEDQIDYYRKMYKEGK